tara:strand:- start:1518 stop:1676 length:159 start_codon:yes stop_codon:yes gene_type:complete
MVQAKTIANLTNKKILNSLKRKAAYGSAFFIQKEAFNYLGNKDSYLKNFKTI